MLSQDPGAIVSQYYSTSLSTAPEQALLFCLDPSRDLIQLSPLWLPMASPEQAPTLSEHEAVVCRGDHISDVLTQASIFSQDPAGAGSQIGWADLFESGPAEMSPSGCSGVTSGVTSYPNRTMRVREPAPIFFEDTDIVPAEQNSTSYTTATSVHASVFSQHSREVGDHINRPTYLPLRSDQVSKFYHNPGGIPSQPNGTGYVVAPPLSLASLEGRPVTVDSFVHTGHNANGSEY